MRLSRSDRQLLTGVAVGSGIAALLWFFGRRTLALPEISPTSVQWEGM